MNKRVRIEPENYDGEWEKFEAKPAKEETFIEQAISTIKYSINKLTFFATICAAYAWLYNLTLQGEFWIKTGEWKTISVHESLVRAKILMDPYFSFYLPDKVGIENMLNGILFSSAPKFSFCMAFLFGIIWMQVEERGW